MLVANPRGIPFSQWAIALTMDNGLALAPPLDEANWVAWVRDLRDAVNFGSELPQTEPYDSWQPWALDALPALENH